MSPAGHRAHGPFLRFTRYFQVNSRVGTVVRVRAGGGVPSSEERHADRFLLALGETGTGGGNAGRRIHLVRAHGG
jgi:hypothetical protein